MIAAETQTSTIGSSYKFAVKTNPGESVVLVNLPPGFLDDLPEGDHPAISEVLGKPIRLNNYDEEGRAELEFSDSEGTIHVVYVQPEFIQVAK
jgi:hypothetical protein